MNNPNENLNDMNTYPDWQKIWRELVTISNNRREARLERGIEDRWHRDAKQFHQRVLDRWSKPDSSRQFVIDSLSQFPGSTILDIGTGSGSWACMLAPHASHVTALDISPSMLDFCRQQVDAAGLTNVTTLLGGWPQVKVEQHDISLCAHAMYGNPDLEEFVCAMQAVTRKRIIMLLRAPDLQGMMAQAAQLVFGYPFDSPNFHVAYQILWKMGIAANVVMEDGSLWKPWRSESLQESLDEMKSRLGIADSHQYDEQFMQLLITNLHQEEDGWVWPAEIRTACVYWNLGNG